MANDTNLAIFTGRAGKDAETRYMPSGKAVCNFSLAVGKSWKDQQDNWQEKTVWVDCAMFGKAAEHYGQKITVGSQWLVHAEYTVDEWEKDGQKQRRPKFIVSKIQAIGGKSGERSESRPEQREPSSAGGGRGEEPWDDEIPFAPIRNGYLL